MLTTSTTTYTYYTTKKCHNSFHLVPTKNRNQISINRNISSHTKYKKFTLKYNYRTRQISSQGNILVAYVWYTHKQTHKIGKVYLFPNRNVIRLPLSCVSISLSSIWGTGTPNPLKVHTYLRANIQSNK